MRFIKALFVLSLSFTVGCGADTGTGDDGGAADTPEIWFISPEAGGVIGHSALIEVGLDGDFERIELISGGVVLASLELTEPAETASLEWDTSDEAEGGVDLFLRGVLTDGDEVTCDPIATVIDHTEPVAVIGPEINWLDIYEWTVSVSIDVEDPHLQSLVIQDDLDNVLLETDTPLSNFSWGVSDGVANGLHTLTLTATDLAGNVTVDRTDGFVLTRPSGQPDITFDRSPFVYFVPADWATTETHIKGWVDAHDNVTKVLAWIRWDASSRWDVEFAVGQGICPHRGIAYKTVSGNSGELLVNLSRESIPPEIEVAFPMEVQGTDVFPDNDDPATFGSFFGHVAVTNLDQHVGESLPIEMHFILVEAD